MTFSELRQVPREDRDLFVRWMVKLARADGVLAPSEMSVIHQLATTWGLEMGSLESLHRSLREGPTLGVDAPPGFLHPRTPYLLVLMLIQLAHEDGCYDRRERDAVHDVAKRYGVPTERVEKMEAWVAQYVPLVAQGRELLQLPTGSSSRELSF